MFIVATGFPTPTAINNPQQVYIETSHISSMYESAVGFTILIVDGHLYSVTQTIQQIAAAGGLALPVGVVA